MSETTERRSFCHDMCYNVGGINCPKASSNFSLARYLDGRISVIRAIFWFRIQGKPGRSKKSSFQRKYEMPQVVYTPGCSDLHFPVMFIIFKVSFLQLRDSSHSLSEGDQKGSPHVRRYPTTSQRPVIFCTGSKNYAASRKSCRMIG